MFYILSIYIIYKLNGMVMIDYDNIILQWQNSVSQYCKYHNIPNMELRNLRTDGCLYDYALYAVYKKAKAAVDTYRKTPSSSAYGDNMVRAIRQWYIATADSRLQKMSMKVISDNMFARYLCRTK